MKPFCFPLPSIGQGDSTPNILLLCGTPERHHPPINRWCTRPRIFQSGSQCRAALRCDHRSQSVNRHVFRVQNLCSEGREQPERGIHQGSATNATEARAAESVISTGGTLQVRKGDKTKTRGKGQGDHAPQGRLPAQSHTPDDQMTSRPISSRDGSWLNSCARSISRSNSSSYTSVIR